MSKQLTCGKLMPGCKTVIEGQDESEVLARAAEHARKDHQVENIPPEMAAQVQAAIEEKN